MHLFRIKRLYLLFFILFAGQLLLAANSTENSSSYFLAYSYLTKYKSIAIEEMNRTGIPASITLAQGMYESGFGKSELAVKGNNHFGIKCKSNWTGAKMYYTDDEPDECFRKYNTSRESYRDHSDFLVNRDYYRSLFDLPRTDYKAWANGLKKAGYATDPNYSSKLIAIIQRFKLYEYDYIQLPQEEEIETAPNADDLYIYASDGVFASTVGAPRTTSQLTNLRRIDVILQQSIEERPMWVAPRSLSGGPVIDVDPDQIKGTIQVPIRKATAATESNLNIAQETQTAQPIVAEIAVLNKPNSYKQNETIVNFEPLLDASQQANTNFDAKQTPIQPTQIAPENATDNQTIANNEAIWINKTKAVRYNHNITPTEIAKQYGLKTSDILAYNDLNNEQMNISAGTNVYIEPKKNRYLGNEKIHIVQNKQDMWDIAQQYGLLLSDLYKRNTMRENTQPLLGEQIVLKGKTDYPPKIRYERKQPNTDMANIPTNSPQANNTNSIFRRTALDSNNGLVFETTAQPQKTQPIKSAATKVQYHTIKQGDNLKDIASKFNTTEEKIRAANNLNNNTKVKSGDILLIIQ